MRYRRAVGEADDVGEEARVGGGEATAPRREPRVSRWGEHLERRLYPGLEEDLEQVSRVRAQIAATAGDSEQKRILIDQQLEPLVRKILSRMEDR